MNPFFIIQPVYIAEALMHFWNLVKLVRSLLTHHTKNKYVSWHKCNTFYSFRVYLVPSVHNGGIIGKDVHKPCKIVVFTESHRLTKRQIVMPGHLLPFILNSVNNAVINNSDHTLILCV